MYKKISKQKTPKLTTILLINMYHHIKTKQTTKNYHLHQLKFI